MKKEFIERVKREMIVDTRKYRYECYNLGNYCRITRIDRDLLDRPAALDARNYKTVYEVGTAPEY